ncbi:Type I Iterative Polyketide synthase (PKS) [Taiwanofungus camphoratus]|nr:Type I Iterative Polyketide synthase (PKS) [Antrodia cinnamomea]
MYRISAKLPQAELVEIVNEFANIRSSCRHDYILSPRTMRSSVKQAPSYTNPDPKAIAIVGMSISAPGGDGIDHGLDVAEFFEFLSRRGSGITKVPLDRWNAEAYYGNGPGQICTTKGGFIPDVFNHDVLEFGITPNEASQMHPTQTSALHQVFNALQRSGIDFRGSSTGVYVGCAGGSPSFELDMTECREYYMTGSSLSIVANRVSFIFDMMGPSLPVDTACSSSLTAMHLASQAIRNGECDQAVVVGVNLIIDVLQSSSFSQLGVLSPDGISKSFDDGANGYARGDIISAVVIKRHDLAVADANHIHAVLVGTALTSCGSSMGSITTPSGEAQSLVIRNAYADAGLLPFQADFAELHGTGTAVGDSIEANAAGAVFSEGRNGDEILIGSVKSNIGHGEMGAYMASLVKAVMMLENNVILPNGYFQKPSSKILFAQYNLRVPTLVEKLIPRDPKLGAIISISSFGFGGSCGHTVLRAHEPRPTLPDYRNGAAQQGPYLFSAGGWSPRAVKSLVEAYRTECVDVPCGALSEHLGSRARQALFRTFVVADSIENAKFPDPVIVPKRPPPLLFCFSGQGPQHWAMGRDLTARFDVFKQSILASDAIHTQYTGESFVEHTGLFIPGPCKNSNLQESFIWPAEIISISITFFQIALFDLMLDLGLKPTAVVGHSIGETAVLYASGAMPREMVIKIAIARGRALKLVDSRGGTMVAISGCDSATVRDLIESSLIMSQTEVKAGDSLHIATYNSATDIGVSGPDYLVDLLINFIDRWVEGVKATKLRVNTAVHSPYVEPCQWQYREELSKIFSEHPGPHTPTIPTMSTVSAKFVSGEYTVEYLWENLRQPVQFYPAISSLMDKYGKDTTFVEISSHPVLSGYLKVIGAKEAVACSKRPVLARHLKHGSKPVTEVHTLLTSLGQLLLVGVNSINFAKLNGCAPVFEGEPSYPFQKKYWHQAYNTPSHAMRRLPRTRPLNNERLRVSAVLPESWMGDHVINFTNLIPAAAYIEMLLEFPDVTMVWDCRFENACILDPKVPAVTLEVKKDGNFVTVKSSTGLETMAGDLAWTRSSPIFDVQHASGKLGYGKPDLSADCLQFVDVDALQARCSNSYTREEFYNFYSDIAQFGPEFKRVNRAIANETEGMIWIKGSAQLNQTDYHLHPAIIDACLQSVVVWSLQSDKIHTNDGRPDYSLPHSLKRGFRNDGSTSPLNPSDECRVYVTLNGWTPDSWEISAYLLDDYGRVLFTLEGVRFEKVQQGIPWPESRFTVEWQPHVLPEHMISRTTWLNGVYPEPEDIQLLRVLDRLAISYTQDFMSSSPPDISSCSSDRQRYREWCHYQAGKPSVGNPSSIHIPEGLRKKFAPLFELSERVANAQQDISSSSTAAVDALFSDDIMSHIYEIPPFCGPVFSQVAAEFVTLVRQIVAAGKRVVRVLEVGAGTGRLTTLLGQALVDANLSDIHIDYVCTDVSISLAQEATSRTPWMTVTPLALDITVPVASQNVDPASFDIITAFDVIHAAPRVDEALKFLRSLLVPGGYLVVIELDGEIFKSGADGSTWLDWVFGSFREWFDLGMRPSGTKHCTLNQADWEDVLTSCDFTSSFWLPDNHINIADHLLFVSQARIPSVTTERLSSASALPNSTVIRHFRAGDELDLVSFFAQLDSEATYSIWLHTSEEAENTTLTGIVRTLRQEFALFKIHLVLFDLTWSSSRQVHFIQTNLIPLPWIDADISVNKAGIYQVPRVVVAPPPVMTEQAKSKALNFEFQGHDVEIWRGFPPPIRDNEVEVDVAIVSTSPAFTGFSEFSGVISMMGQEVDARRLSIGQKYGFTCHNSFDPKLNYVPCFLFRVFGLVPHTPGNIIVCCASCVAPVPTGWSLPFAAAIVGRLLFSRFTNVLVDNPHPVTAGIILHAGHGSSAALSVYKTLASRFQKVVVTVNTLDASASFPLKLSGDAGPFDSASVSTWAMAARRLYGQGVQYAFVFDPSPDVLHETISLLGPGGTLVYLAYPGKALTVQLKWSQKFISVSPQQLVDELSIEESVATITPGLLSSLAPHYRVVNLHLLRSGLDDTTHQSSADEVLLTDLRTLSPDLAVLRGGVRPDTKVFDPRKSYILIGGIGGIGFAIVQVMVQFGARHIVLTSRSGEKAFSGGKLAKEKRILTWLRSLPGVQIDLVALDCVDLQGMKAMLRSLCNPVGGIFHLAVALADAMFTTMTCRDDWDKVYDVKVKGLQVILDAVDPKSLDFLVLMSSMASVTGSPGQTWMESLATKIPNTTTVAVPPVTDCGIFARALSKVQGRNAALDKYTKLGVTGIELAYHCIEAIRSIGTDKPITFYIPPMNWRQVIETNVVPYTLSLLRHLVKKESNDRTEDGTGRHTIRAECAKVLSLDTDQVEVNVPLSTYGLDSLTSVRLSNSLKANFGVIVTQLQLLGGNMTVSRLESMQEEQLLEASASRSRNTAINGSAHSEQNQMVDLSNTLVPLNNAEDGKPLFIIHGAGGGVLVLQKMAERLPFPVYGVQDTVEAPLMGTLRRLSAFYAQKIREKQPNGPYRLAGFSFGTAVALEIAILFQAEGQTVESLIMLDGSPTLYDDSQFRDHTMSQIASGSLREDIMRIVRDMVASETLDGTNGILDQFTKHFDQSEGSGSHWVRRFCAAYAAHIMMGLRAAIEWEKVVGTSHSRAFSQVMWPTKRTVLIKASKGVASLSHASSVSPMFSLEKHTSAVEVHELQGTHFGILHPESGIVDVMTKILA